MIFDTLLPRSLKPLVTKHNGSTKGASHRVKWPWLRLEENRKGKLQKKRKKHYKHKQNTFSWEQGDQNNNLIQDMIFLIIYHKF